jgi:two-component system, chemotaxis family, sensor kinase CheA
LARENTHEPMLDLFIFETTQLIQQLEQIIIACDNSEEFSLTHINEIFRIMHTIKGSSAMMLFNNISSLAHSMEDIFFFLREEKPQGIDNSALTDLVLDSLDFIKIELLKMQNGDEVDGNASEQIHDLQSFLTRINNQDPKEFKIKQKFYEQEQQQYYITKLKSEEPYLLNNFQATIHFEVDCGMENLRAFGVTTDLSGIVEEFCYVPEDIDDEESIHVIREKGFLLYLKTNYSFEDIHQLLSKTVFLKNLELIQLDNDELFRQFNRENRVNQEDKDNWHPNRNKPVQIPVLNGQGQKEASERENLERESTSTTVQQSFISVSVEKLDALMDLVGELVIAEAMVAQNPDIIGRDLPSFQKAERQLHKITNEIQDMVMSVRMVPLTATFQKMNRTVRDMCKKLNKEVQLKLVGEETEVDKNIIEHISDPLMHLIRNSIDHGIEFSEVREARGKPKVGTVTLEAGNAGSDVLIRIRDDGEGFNKERILAKARENNLLTKPENEMSEKEIYNLIFLPGFSTNDVVTEFSGRGVGMDVVNRNIEAVGGSIIVDSVADQGTTITLKIPLTLAIIDGMNIRVGNSRYTIPINTIRESFRPREQDIITDPDNNEMIMVRGECYPLLRLHELYRVKTEVRDLTQGILIMVEHNNQTLCIFGDELIGQQQVVVKALPAYIKKTKKIVGLAGCTLLGDGGISLILDVSSLIGQTA